jgi:hypothetical protein
VEHIFTSSTRNGSCEKVSSSSKRMGVFLCNHLVSFLITESSSYQLQNTDTLPNSPIRDGYVSDMDTYLIHYRYVSNEYLKIK